MIDPKLLRAEPESVRRGLQARGGRALPVFEEALSVDARHREAQRKVEDLRAQMNALSKEIGKLKAQKADATEVLAKAEALKAGMAEAEAAAKESEPRLHELLLALPNLPDASVPVGADEKDNKEVRRHGEPKTLPFAPKDHHDLGHALGILDLETATKLAGSRFPLLKGQGARLERALVQFMLDLAGEHGYTEVAPPFLVNRPTITGTAQLPKFEDDQYKTSSDDLFLIPTSEVPLTNLHRDEILDEGVLPLRYTAATPCFRREAGSYGKDTRGIIRVHQFQKVELVWLTAPEKSFEALEALTGHAEEVLKRLGLPYRVLALCSGDMGFASAKTYDLEVWMAGEGRYREVSSCSNCTDFQARRMNTRLRRSSGGKPELVHTLNGSGVAAGRVLAALLEYGQQADGSVLVPEALRRYTGFDRLQSASAPARA